jgi:hypothetical protein
MQRDSKPKETKGLGKRKIHVKKVNLTFLQTSTKINFVTMMFQMMIVSVIGTCA